MKKIDTTHDLGHGWTATLHDRNGPDESMKLYNVNNGDNFILQRDSLDRLRGIFAAVDAEQRQ